MAAPAAPRHARTRRRIPHEPALDGLRGVAVVLVLLFHGGVGVVGGALGVDVFLVLSGFLITALLLAERDSTGGVDLLGFWGRRVRRLVPAAMAVVVAVVVHAAVTGSAGAGLRLDAIASLGWWSNWRFAASDAGYFESFGPPSPLRHTWSLAVEEQWYLLWPLLLGLLVRLARSPRGLAAVIVVLASASAAAMWAVAADPDRAHYGTDTRAQALLAGAALAVVVHRRPVQGWSPLTGRLVAAAGVAGAAVVLALSLWLPGTDARLYQGGHQLVAVASVAVIAACLLPSGPLRRGLANRPLRAVGRVSYGLYLWHWPLFVWLTPDVVGLDRWPTFVVRVAVTSVVTVASWRLLERPVLERRFPVPRPRLALAGAYAASVALVLATTISPGGPSGSPLATAQPTLPAGFVAAAPGPGRPAAAVVEEVEEVEEASPAAVLSRPPEPAGRTGDPRVTVVGDSMGWKLAWLVEPVSGLDIHNGSAMGCGVDPAPIVVNGRPEVRDAVPVPCDQLRDLWRWHVATTDPDVVVVTIGAWEVYDRELADGTRLRVGSPEWEAWMGPILEEVAAELAAAAPHAVVAFTEVPCFDEDDPSLGGPASARNDDRRVAALNEVLYELVARYPRRLATLGWSRWLCGDGAVERYDGVHLSDEGALALWRGPLGEEVRALSDRARG